MANIQLIKDILADKANEYTIYDIFSEDELEYENEIIFYSLDSFDLTGDEILNDQYVRDEELMDDAEKMTDERRISHGIRYLNAAIKKKYEEDDIISSDIYMYQTIDIDDTEIVICYSVSCENQGMGIDIAYEDASFEGIFESYNKLKEYYVELGYFVLYDECDAKCIYAKGKYILDSWEKDSIEKETPKEKEDRLVKERVSTKFKVYTTPACVVEIGKTIPEKLKKFDSFVIVNYTGINSPFHRENNVLFNSFKEEGIKMYFASALGVDFKWSKTYTRCIVNISHEEAIHSIKWSDSHFGVWYDGSVPIILYV